MATATLSTGVWPIMRELVSLTKPRVTFVVLLTSAGGMALAEGSLSPGRVLAMLAGMVCIVGCANALNCWMERDSDALMSRTRERSLPAGRISANTALWFALCLFSLAMPLLTLWVNPMTGLLGALAVALYVGAYTPLKSRSPSALVVGAVPGALPPLMGVTAVTAEPNALGWVLFGVLFLWQMPHVIGLSCFRKDEYARAGMKVLPVVRGDRVSKWHALLWAIALLPCSLALLPLGLAGPIYGVSAGLLGLGYIATVLVGFRSEPAGRWGRRLFMVSLLYLPLLFTALILDIG